MKLTEWRDVLGYEGLYKVNNFGQVFSRRRPSAKGGILKPNLYGDYAIVFLYKNDAGKPRTIHRLVAQAFIPNPENKPYLNHKDADKFNNSVDNLEWCTAKENSHHASINGLFGDRKGEKNNKAKITEADVRKIRELHLNGVSQAAIARQFPINHQNVHKIISGQRWGHVI